MSSCENGIMIINSDTYAFHS